jgi:hypothetical protein
MLVFGSVPLLARFVLVARIARASANRKIYSV